MMLSSMVRSRADDGAVLDVVESGCLKDCLTWCFMAALVKLVLKPSPQKINR